MTPSILRALGALSGRAAGRGLLWTVVTLIVQLVLVVSGWGRMHESPAAPPRGFRTLDTAVVVQPPFGGEPGAVVSGESWPEHSQIQLNFEANSDGWTAVLWFSGDRVDTLYPDPDLDQSGFTGGGLYAVPGPGQWLQLTATPPEGDFLALVHSPSADPRVVATLESPTPRAVRLLRSQLEAEAAGWAPNPVGVQRYLPTADGRAIPVSWERTRSIGTLVRGWTVKTER